MIYNGEVGIQKFVFKRLPGGEELKSRKMLVRLFRGDDCLTRGRGRQLTIICCVI